MDIERLRALEKDIRESAALADAEALGVMGINRPARWADELAALIAELGQEVGAEQAPVAWIRPDGVTTSDDGLARHWASQGLPHRPLVYGDSSPAHTSEARDAERLNWPRGWKIEYTGEEKFPLRITEPHGINAWEMDAGNLACQFFIAAMRQEGE